MLRMESISKVYSHRGGPVTGIQNVCFEVPDGDFVSVVGPSGSGKSTLLLILGGMLSPTEGKVLFGDKDVYSLHPNERARLRREKIGFLFQTFNLVPYLTALENVQIPLLLGGADGPAQRKRAGELLERMGLDARIDHKPSELSVGQQQRVALARVLANNPKVILADEPTGNLDPDTRERVMTFLAEANREGRTVVLVTHDPGVAERSNRTLRLVDGRIVSDKSQTR